MKFQQQHRPLIYHDKEDIDSFLEEDSFWADLYELFLDIKDNSYLLKIPSVKIFNEVRYQCTRVLLDKHPEENIWDNYLNPVKESLGWRYASDLCFALVYVVLVLMNNPPSHVAYFLHVLRNRKLKADSCYFPYVEKFLSSKSGFTHKLNLAPMPAPLNCIGQEVGWWGKMTNDFDQDCIREIVALWKDPRAQQKVLDAIEHDFDSHTVFIDFPF